MRNEGGSTARFRSSAARDKYRQQCLKLRILHSAFRIFLPLIEVVGG